MLKTLLNTTLSFLSRYKRIIQLLVAIISIGIIARLFAENIETFLGLLNFKVWHLVTLWVLYLIYFLVSAVPHWMIIERLSGKTVAFSKWIKIMFVGRTVNNLVTKGGSVYKAMMLKQNNQISYAKYIQIYSFFTWFTSFLNFGIASLVIIITMPGFKVNGILVMPFITGLFVMTLLAPWLIKPVMKWHKPESGLFLSLYEKINGIFEAMREHGQNRVFIAKLTGLVLIKFLLHIILFKIIFAGINTEITFAHLALLIAIQNISVQISITPGNVGVRELVYGAVCGATGVGVAQGIMASAFLRAITYLVVFPPGIAFGGADLLQKKQQTKTPPSP